MTTITDRLWNSAPFRLMQAFSTSWSNCKKTG
jgi:hypothetical protein